MRFSTTFTPPVEKYLRITMATWQRTCATRKPGWKRPVNRSLTASSEQSDAPERRKRALRQWKANRRRPAIGDVHPARKCCRMDKPPQASKQNGLSDRRHLPLRPISFTVRNEGVTCVCVCEPLQVRKGGLLETVRKVLGRGGQSPFCCVNHRRGCYAEQNGDSPRHFPDSLLHYHHGQASGAWRLRRLTLGSVVERLGRSTLTLA